MPGADVPGDEVLFTEVYPVGKGPEGLVGAVPSVELVVEYGDRGPDGALKDPPVELGLDGLGPV